jgi:hypothetical protein
MLTVKDVTLDNGRYGEGFTCAVSFQIGSQSYNTVKIELLPDATRSVVELAISEAKAMLAAEASDIRIKGEAEPSAEPVLPAFLTEDDIAPRYPVSPVSADEQPF